MSGSRAWTRMPSPLGPLLLVGHDGALEQIVFPAGRHATVEPPDLPEDDTAFERSCEALRRYFAGSLVGFDLVLAPTGTEFQKSVWRELASIPFGDTVTYADIARRIDRPTASRAVGAANGANPLPIVVPCHRVIGANGTLTGFAGGLEAKRFLLEHEARIRSDRGEPVRQQLVLELG